MKPTMASRDDVGEVNCEIERAATERVVLELVAR
jgi:hypothetical protein